MSNPFFKNYGPITLFQIFNSLNINTNDLYKDTKVNDIKDLVSAAASDITFFHSKKYNDVAKKTKASFCITTNKLKKDLPENCLALVVDNVLVSTAKITSLFYPDSTNDNFDETVSSISDTKYKDKVNFGKNVLIGKNVSIGADCKIGHNTIIEKNVIIGNNCSIGSNTIIRNTILKSG